jgi:hypothetical protein
MSIDRKIRRVSFLVEAQSLARARERLDAPTDAEAVRAAVMQLLERTGTPPRSGKRGKTSSGPRRRPGRG